MERIHQRLKPEGLDSEPKLGTVDRKCKKPQLMLPNISIIGQ